MPVFPVVEIINVFFNEMSIFFGCNKKNFQGNFIPVKGSKGYLYLMNKLF